MPNSNEISGVEGSVLVNGTEIEATDMSWDGDYAVIDRSNYTTAGNPYNAGGQHTGNISANGPISRITQLVAKGVVGRALLTFRLRVTPTIYVEVQGRVSKHNMTGSHANGANWTINAAQYGPPTLVGL